MICLFKELKLHRSWILNENIAPLESIKNGLNTEEEEKKMINLDIAKTPTKSQGIPNFTDSHSFPLLNEQKTTAPLTLENFSKEKTNEKHKKGRRIKPTLVKNTEIQLGFVFSSKPEASKNNDLSSRNYLVEKNRRLFDASPLVDSSSKGSLSDERELLRKTKISLSPKKKVGSTNSIISPSPSPLKVKSISSFNYIKPSLEKVTDKNLIDTLIELYLTCFQLNSCYYFVSELEFLLQLLGKRMKSEKLTLPSSENLIEKVFSIFHNCIYFSVAVIEKLYLYGYLKVLSPLSLTLLSENVYIVSLFPDFSSILKLEKPSHGNHLMFKTYQLSSVAFEPELDSKVNYPNEQSFTTFRRQRDSFYLLYEKWKEFNFKSSINENEYDIRYKAQEILNISTDCGNYYHLARLFVSQMIKSCVGHVDENKSNVDQLHESKVEDKFPKTKEMNIRLKKLNKRFCTDIFNNDYSEEFSKNESFFCKFIIFCNNDKFNTYLRLIMKNKIEEFNCTKFSVCYKKDEITSEQIELFETVTLTLKLLAKFIGLLDFAPYYTKTNKSKKFY